MRAVVFDLGGVLIHWDPRLLYRKLLPSEAEVERFLSDICTSEWNAQQDAGRPIDAGVAELVERFPAERSLIEAWRDRFPEMMRSMTESLEIFDRLHAQGTPLYALSNWGAESFETTRPLFPFLERFDGMVISGREGVIKPDPAIFRLLMERFGLDVGELVFVDDHAPNTAAAASLGIDTIHFSGAQHLERELRRLDLL